MAIGLIVIGLIVFFVLWIFLVLIPLHDAADVLPFEYQTMSGSSVWLLLIPLFNLVWLYFVIIRISDGYRRYFEAKQIETHGNCGFGVGLAWAICTSVSVTPYLGGLTSIGALVCMIVYVVTIVGCKNAALALINDDDISALAADEGPEALPAAPEAAGLLPGAGIEPNEPR